jgi:hypothetical protein
MPETKPAASDLNFTPSSTAPVSFSCTPVVVGGKIEHGHVCGPTSNATLASGPMLALSSMP